MKAYKSVDAQSTLLFLYYCKGEKVLHLVLSQGLHFFFALLMNFPSTNVHRCCASRCSWYGCLFCRNVSKDLDYYKTEISLQRLHAGYVIYTNSPFFMSRNFWTSLKDGRRFSFLLYSNMNTISSDDLNMSIWKELII